METVESVWNILDDSTEPQNIFTTIQSMITFSCNRENINEYGEGNSSKRIIERVVQ